MIQKTIFIHSWIFRMKAAPLLCALFLHAASLAFPSNLGTLEGIIQPSSLAVSGNEVFILEGATVSAFSLDDLHLIRTFGREGQGPGELEVLPWLSSSLSVLDDRICIDSAAKLLFFTKEGKLIDEKRRSQQFTQMIPAGKNFVVRMRVSDPKENIQFSTINLYNPDSEETTELYRQKFSGQFQEVDMIPDSIHVQVYEDKIYIEESPKGFVIEVFNSFGKKLSQISKDYKKLAFSKKDRKQAEERLRLDPMTKLAPGGWETMKNQYKLNYPSFFPPIRNLVINDNKIYILTYKNLESREEYIILDLDGNERQRINLPEVEKPGFTTQMMGTGGRLFTISQGKFYNIVVQDEWCELHCVEIPSID